MHGGVFLRHVTFWLFCLTTEQRQKNAVRRGAACIVAPEIINTTVYLFLKRGAAQCSVWWGRTFKLGYSRR